MKVRSDRRPNSGGRPWLVSAVVSLFVGLMIATAGFAIHPPIADIATPLVCDGEAVHVTFRGSYHPSELAESPNIYCITGGTNGAREEITLSAIGASFLVYSAFAFLLVAPAVLLFTRSNRGRDRPPRR